MSYKNLIFNFQLQVFNNKETLVTAGELVMSEAKKNNVKIQENYFTIQFKFVILSRRCVTKYKAKREFIYKS